MSGRDGLALIHELYEGIVPPPEISNIIVNVKQKKKKSIADMFKEKGYKVNIVVVSEKDELIEQCEKLMADCLGGGYKNKLGQVEFTNTKPSYGAKIKTNNQMN